MHITSSGSEDFVPSRKQRYGQILSPTRNARHFSSSMHFDLLLCYLRFRRGGGYAALLRCWINKKYMIASAGPLWTTSCEHMFTICCYRNLYVFMPCRFAILFSIVQCWNFWMFWCCFRVIWLFGFVFYRLFDRFQKENCPFRFPFKLPFSISFFP